MTMFEEKIDELLVIVCTFIILCITQIENKKNTRMKEFFFP